MAGISDIFGAVTKLTGIQDLVLSVLDRVKTSPELRAQIEQQMATNQKELAAIDAELEAKITEAASANIKADAASGDKYTSRARPTFLYICNIMLLWNYILAPLLGRVPLEFPEPLFWLFGSAILGYTGSRSWEKVTISKGKK